MNFSFYTFITWLLIPALQILTGWGLKQVCSIRPNFWIGYRTARSMKNKDTWKFANLYAGALYMRIGMITIWIPVVLLLVLMHQSAYVIHVVGTVLMLLQAALLIIPAFSVEKQLKISFQ